MTEICEKCEVEYPDKFGNIIHCNTIEPKLSGTYEFEWKDSDTMYSRVEGNTVHLTSKNPTQQDYQALFDALVPLMKVADVLSDKLPDSLGLWSQTSSEEGGDIRLTIGDVRKIRAALQQCAKGCGEIDDVYIPSHRSYRDIDSILTSFELEQRANEELAVIKSIRRVLLMPVNPLHRTQKGD